MADVTRLVTDGKHGDCEDEADSGYYFLSSKDLRDGCLHYDKPRQITQVGFLETHRRTNLQPGDVLLTNCGASIGRVGIAQNDPRIRRTTFQKSVSVIKPNIELIDGKFLYYFLLGRRELLIQLGGGTAQSNLLIGDLKKIDVALPPKQVQRRIARILSSFDDLIATNSRRVQLLEEAARCIYDERFGGVPDPLPDNWKARHITDVCAFVKGKEPGRKNYLSEPAEGVIPFLRVGDLSKRRSELFVERSLVGDSILNEQDIAISLDGTVGLVRHGLIGAYSSGIRKVVPIDESVGRAFVYQYLQSRRAQEVIAAHANGATILHASSSLKHLLVPVPPLASMQEFERQVGPMMDLVVTLERKSFHLRELRDLLLPKLIDGEIDVSRMATLDVIAA